MTLPNPNTMKIIVDNLSHMLYYYTIKRGVPHMHRLTLTNDGLRQAALILPMVNMEEAIKYMDWVEDYHDEFPQAIRVEYYAEHTPLPPSFGYIVALHAYNLLMREIRANYGG